MNMVDLEAVYDELASDASKHVGDWKRNTWIPAARKDCSDPLGSGWYIGYVHQDGANIMISNRFGCSESGRIQVSKYSGGAFKTDFEFDTVADLFASMRDGEIAEIIKQWRS